MRLKDYEKIKNTKKYKQALKNVKKLKAVENKLKQA